MTAWTPPAWYRSSMWCTPAGASLQMCGTFAATSLMRRRSKLEAGLGGDRRQVQHGVGAAAQAGVGGQGVADRGVGERCRAA